MPIAKNPERSDAERAAKNRYFKKNFATLAVKVDKVTAEKFKAFCVSQGQTVNGVLSEYVKECIKD